MIRRYLPKNVEEFTQWYMRWVSPVSLIAGFLLDNLVLFKRVDVWTTNALLFMHLAIAGACIVLLNLAQEGRFTNRRLLVAVPFLPVAAQFSFGALFSAFLSLYGRSAAFADSWVFIIILAGLIIMNERFAHFYMRLYVQVAAYFVVLFSFLIFFLPLVVHDIGPVLFLCSGAVSLVGIAAFLFTLEYLVPERKRDRTNLARIVAVLFLLMNALYFTGSIPPLPLALKEAGVYHGVARVGDEYRLLAQPLPWYQYYLRYNTTYLRAPSEAVYVYSAVFAPSGLSTTLYHQWQQYNEDTQTWSTVAEVPFYIVGGRDGGYRGYSVKSTNLSEGKWRVNVVTSYRQIIGRISFTIRNVDEPVQIETLVR